MAWTPPCSPASFAGAVDTIGWLRDCLRVRLRVKDDVVLATATINAVDPSRSRFTDWLSVRGCPSWPETVTVSVEAGYRTASDFDHVD